MKYRRSLLVWSAFTLCALLVLGAMAWLTRGVIVAESQRSFAEAEREAAERRADVEERTRLALWRMDAEGAALVLRESRSLPPQARGSDPPEVLLRFEAYDSFPIRFPALEKKLSDQAELEARIVRFRELLAAHPLPGTEWQLLQSATLQSQTNWQVMNQDSLPADLQTGRSAMKKTDVETQMANNRTEKMYRGRAIDQALEVTNSPPLDSKSASLLESAPPPTEISPMRAVWLGEELLLLRQVTQGQITLRLEGVWLDWNVLSDHLLGKISDLLPGAELVPAIEEEALRNPLTLVSFPLTLARPKSSLPSAVVSEIALNIPLLIAWGALICALGASACLASGIMRLSHRRASFVSAVTHELRTPLTTFRLYSDLLSQKAVSEENQTHYLDVLSREAERLSHLVENVLAFSRIENGGGASKKRLTTVEEMFTDFRPRFRDRLASAGLALEIKTTPEAATASLHLDPSLVEHLLFNLIDNAAKYAHPSDPAIVQLEAKTDGRHLEISVRDHGPGIPDGDRWRIFKAFHKSALAAAETQPGVGLGLALARRLAQALGGSLEAFTMPHGACFVLKIAIPKQIPEGSF